MTAVASAPLKDRVSEKLVDELISRLRRRQVVGAQQTAIETFHVLRQVVARARFTEISELIELVKTVGRRLVAAQPKEHAVGNIVRKFLHLIREEGYASGKLSAPVPRATSLSLADFIRLAPARAQTHGSAGAPRSNGAARDQTTDDDSERSDGEADGDFKGLLMDGLREILDELETVYENVGKNAKDHIHSDEIILTIGRSRTIEAFLKTASHTRKFTVIVAETAPSYSGRDMAASLAAQGISTVLVPDSAIFALLSRVNKVLLGAHAILADGGMFAPAGALLAAAAARAHAVPVVVCAGQFKLTPKWGAAAAVHAARDFADPSAVLPFAEGALVEQVDVLNPYWDFVRPEMIDVYITNYGDHAPSFIHRLIKDSYDDDDTEL
ncbi:nagb/rpia/CoA transferase-like protein [Auricularia subglabra TFB-10046 SS5]|nr:nagb/rpia/CoA transferase-like protein [Auricularia subglabra TFB-10046 SS5]